MSDLSEQEMLGKMEERIPAGEVIKEGGSDVAMGEFELARIDQDIIALEKRVADGSGLDIDQFVSEEEDPLKIALREAAQADQSNLTAELARLRRERDALTLGLETLRKAAEVE